MRLIIVSGKSGSGKTSALHLMEDEGMTCIDNLPVDLLPVLIQQLSQEPERHRDVAIGIDARNITNDLSKLPKIIEAIRHGGRECDVLFLDTADEVLLKRFSETRRRHPLSDQKHDLKEAIALEHALLRPIAELADHTLNTSHFSLHELRSAVRRAVVKNDQRTGLAIVVSSFGFKYGTPADCDYLFDVRCLPNPYWNPSLRGKSGLEQSVIRYLDQQQPVQAMLADLISFFEKWLPSFEENNRSYVTIGIGCTGGMHRSVYLTEKLAKQLRKRYNNVQTRHRQLRPTLERLNAIESKSHV